MHEHYPCQYTTPVSSPIPFPNSPSTSFPPSSLIPTGVRIATVYTDPTIVAGKENFHETQSKVYLISSYLIVFCPVLPFAIILLYSNSYFPSLVLPVDRHCRHGIHECGRHESKTQPHCTHRLQGTVKSLLSSPVRHNSSRY